MLCLTNFENLNTHHQIHITECLFNIFTCFVMYNDLFETKNIHINVNLLKIFKKVIRKIILDGLIIKSDKVWFSYIAEINELLKEKKTKNETESAME
jgi:hypothetical protein